MAASSNSWQVKLREHCISARIEQPVWQDISDRRGSRTAWSSIVLIQGRQIPARYWYDGPHVENAREDAAELALQFLGVITSPRASRPNGLFSP